MTTTLPFSLLAPGFAAGDVAPDGWMPLHAVNLLILVGVTGVGKSSLLRQLARLGPAFTLLPDRRVLTDALIIGRMQTEDGLRPAPVVDRADRFAYTRRYRERFPGGMAAALVHLWVETPALPDLFVFDGLRGANEIEFAAQALPQARFVMLHAPDNVRVQRLLGRDDTFDQVKHQTEASYPGRSAGFSGIGVPEASACFTREEEAMMLGLVAGGEVTAVDLAAKLRIVLEERRNYDPVATATALIEHARRRALLVDSVTHTPDQVAVRLAAWLQEQGT